MSPRTYKIKYRFHDDDASMVREYDCIPEYDARTNSLMIMPAFEGKKVIVIEIPDNLAYLAYSLPEIDLE